MTGRARSLLIGGLWAASLSAVLLVTRESRPPGASAPPSGERTVVVERQGADRLVPTGGLGADQLRAIVREELAIVTRADATVSPDDAPAPTRDDAAFARADESLATAMADGRWTDDDRSTFHTSLIDLDRDQIELLLQTIAPAINRGELAVETAGSPL